ncbi:MAG: response regulator [Steroidobacteraceae bacterium]
MFKAQVPSCADGTRVSGGQARARVVIAEDHPVMRAGLADLLEQEPGIELVGFAENAREVEKLMRAHEPDTLVLDLTLGPDDGIDLAQQLLRTRPALRIVVLSMHDELLYGDRLRTMGVLAYVTKDRTRSEFLLALRSVLEGRPYFTAQQRKRLDLHVSSEPLIPEAVLSSRELDVLRLLASGKTSSAIAAELSVAAKTVYSHRHNISTKLGISSSRELLKYAVHWVRRSQVVDRRWISPP